VILDPEAQTGLCDVAAENSPMIFQLAKSGMRLSEVRRDPSHHRRVAEEGESFPTEPEPTHHVPVPTRRRSRRAEPRYLAIIDQVWVMWWQGDEYLGRSGRLVNVSRHGAMILSSFLFREGQALRLFLEEPAPRVGVDASVLGVIEGVEGVHQVRLGFTRECPDEFFEAASYGFESWLSRQAT
jgi:hypothetical protein